MTDEKKGPIHISTPLKEFQDNMARNLYGVTKSEAISKGICIACKLPAKPRIYSDAGRREYQISGLCEVCFDEITKPRDEEDE